MPLVSGFSVYFILVELIVCVSLCRDCGVHKDNLRHAQMPRDTHVDV